MALTKEQITELQKAFKLVLGNDKDESVKLVLGDLSRFCREKESCFHADPRIHAVLEGRREVILRIRDFVELTPDQYLEKYGRTTP